MLIKSLASSSKGNCYLIQDGVSSLLLECGINLDKVREHIKLTDLNGCLITHEHQDHSKYAKEIIKYCEVYSSRGTLESLDLGDYNYKAIAMKPNVKQVINSFLVIPFEVQHDCKEPLGYLLYSFKTNEYVLFATDTYYIKSRFKDLDYVMVECNYANDILKANIEKGSIPKEVSKRLFSSHFELNNVKEFLKINVGQKTKEIWLLHLSDGNSDAKRFKREIQELTGKVVVVCES